MKTRSGDPCGCHGTEEHPVAKQAAFLDSAASRRYTHPDNAAGAAVKMANFAIAHLAVRQADSVARALDQCVGILLQPFVEVRSTGERYGIAVAPGGIAEPVEDY